MNGKSNGKQSKGDSDELKSKYEKEFGKLEANKLLNEWLQYKNEKKDIDTKGEVLRLCLLSKVAEKYPDEKRGAKIEVDEYNIRRTVIPKVKWDQNKLKGIVGQSIFKQIIEIEVSIDEKKLKQKIDEGAVKYKDVAKACDVNYIQQLRVMIRGEDNTKENESETRELIELMDR